MNGCETGWKKTLERDRRRRGGREGREEKGKERGRGGERGERGGEGKGEGGGGRERNKEQPLREWLVYGSGTSGETAVDNGGFQQPTK